jgi:endonuclease/exonuclease/phosphatase family metal-dependent hydrolase
MDRVQTPEVQSKGVVLTGEFLAENGVLFLPRVLTYNVHRCVGVDGLLSPQRISQVIASCQPDIVALQELDVRRSRTGGIDQAHWIGGQLGMGVHFHPAMGTTNELYGDAILTALPSRLIKAGVLPTHPSRRRLEPRGALWVSVALDHAEVQLLNTHLGLNRHERLAHVEALLGPEWLGNNPCRSPVIVLGDFNALPGSRGYARLASRLRDAQQLSPSDRPRATFPAPLPLLRVDHVFVSRFVEVLEVRTLRHSMARAASDHLPLCVDFRVVSPVDQALHREHSGRSSV